MSVKIAWNNTIERGRVMHLHNSKNASERTTCGKILINQKALINYKLSHTDTHKIVQVKQTLLQSVKNRS